MKDDVQFLMKNSRATYPAIPMDGLQLWYDVKGKKDGDIYKNTILDLSGNNRHATLQNFAYKKYSGYHQGEGLVFDGVDDKLVLPTLPDFTYEECVFGGENLILQSSNVKTVTGNFNWSSIADKTWQEII